MTRARRSSNDALGSYLRQAADDFSRSGQSLGEDAEGLLFLGAWHQSYPAILVRDPFLSDSAKVHFLYLMQESSQNPNGAIAMPSLHQAASTLGHSWRTAQRDRTLLRVCRWISQHRVVRDERGRYCGTINAIHSEPCSLHDANRLDATYLQLLESSRESADPYTARAAQAALANIDQTLEAGEDPLAPVDPMMRRQEAAHAVQSGGSFFELMMPRGGHTVATQEPAETIAESAHGEIDPYAKSATEEGGHSVANSKSGKAAAKSAYGQPDPYANSASESGGHTVATPGLSEKFAYGDPYAKFAYGDKDPDAKSAYGQEEQLEQELTPKQGVSPSPAPTPTCSSSSTTTTTTKTGSARDDELRWPESLPANERTLIGRGFDTRGFTQAQRQDVLDALAHKLHDPDNPVRSPVAYAVTLCKRVEGGTFQPIGAPRRTKAKPLPDPAASETRQIRQRIQALRSEIDGLESTLIPGAPPENRPALESQRDRLQDELDELRRRLRELRGSSDRGSKSHA